MTSTQFPPPPLLWPLLRQVARAHGEQMGELLSHDISAADLVMEDSLVEKDGKPRRRWILASEDLLPAEPSGHG